MYAPCAPWPQTARRPFDLDDPDGALRYAVAEPFELLPWLLSWGASAEVLEPEILRARVREEILRLLEILT